MSKEYEIYEVDAELYNCNSNFPDMIGFALQWTSNMGFGTLTFHYNIKTGEWDYDSECMSKKFCKAVLDKWLEKVMTPKESN